MTQIPSEIRLGYAQNITAIATYSFYYQMVTPTLANGQDENSRFYAFDVSTIEREVENTPITFVNNLIDNFSPLLYQFVENNFAKDKVDTMIVHSTSASIYYGFAAPLLQGTSLEVKANVAMGLKVFSAVANPFIAQFVEAFTEKHINNFKNLYDKTNCLLGSASCNDQEEVSNNFVTEVSNNVLEDFFQLDFGKISNDVYQNVNNLSFNDLFISGYTSALASEIKDYTYLLTGFDQHCQGYFCKNWLSYYYKDAIKSVIKKEFISTEATSSAEETTPLRLDDVITLGSDDIFAGITSQNSTQGLELPSNQTCLLPLMQVDHLLMEVFMIAQPTDMCAL